MNIIQTRQGRLWDGDKEFRFLGMAAPNLHLNECQVYPDFRNRFPNDFEISDTLESIKQMGGLVTRLFCLSLATEKDPAVPCHIRTDGSLTEEAFECLDAVIYHADRLGIRLIIPLLDSHSFPGWRGVDEWAVSRGKEPSEFWTDPTCKTTWKKVIRSVVGRHNTKTGRAYRDEGAILAWQIGNELDSWPADRSLSREEWLPKITSWSLEMAAELRESDANHLIMEGGGLREIYVNSPLIDVVSDHYYEYWNRMFGKPDDLASMNKASLAQCAGRKPLIADEFGMASLENTARLLDEIRSNGTAGALLWSIRSHRRDGGFYHHNENGSHFNSYHWPGFTSGNTYNEITILDLVHRESYAIRNQPCQRIPAPAVAVELLPEPSGQASRVLGVQMLRWKGVTGARFYQIDRRLACSDQTWLCLSANSDDAPVLDTAALEANASYLPAPQYCDLSAGNCLDWEYRVRAGNENGWGPWSQVGVYTC